MEGRRTLSGSLFETKVVSGGLPVVGLWRLKLGPAATPISEVLLAPLAHNLRITTLIWPLYGVLDTVVLPVVYNKGHPCQAGVLVCRPHPTRPPTISCNIHPLLVWSVSP